jgi:hypothetical protein
MANEEKYYSYKTLYKYLHITVIAWHSTITTDQRIIELSDAVTWLRDLYPNELWFMAEIETSGKQFCDIASQFPEWSVSCTEKNYLLFMHRKYVSVIEKYISHNENYYDSNYYESLPCFILPK